ncbi:MAG: hypothetical protein H6Q72_169 [Firmicutes bacterium]|nr:hypothetical protein [Bacillota bacterium]
MPTFRIIINGEETDDCISGKNYMEAYFLALQAVPHAYKNDFKLIEKEETTE